MNGIKAWHIRLLSSVYITFGTLLHLDSVWPPSILSHLYVMFFTVGTLGAESLALYCMRILRILSDDPEIQEEERHNPFTNIYLPHYIRDPEDGEEIYFQPSFYSSVVMEVLRQTGLICLNSLRGFSNEPTHDDIFHHLACPVAIYFFVMEWVTRYNTSQFKKNIREKARAAADRRAQKLVQGEEKENAEDEKPLALTEKATANSAAGDEEVRRIQDDGGHRHRFVTIETESE